MDGQLLKRLAYVAASGLILAMCGCACHNCKSSEEMAVQLPRGFHPLRGYETGDAGATHNGWPRYIYSEQDHMVMVYVPSQEILMGGGTQPDEVPARHVRVNHFYIDIHEVTNSQFGCFVRTAKEIKVVGPGRCGEEVCAPMLHEECVDVPNDTTWVDQQIGKCFGNWKTVKPQSISMFRQYWKPSINNSHPVRAVSWREAWQYSRWSGKRMPSEAQWEAAARGDDGRVYPWGNQTQSDVTRYLCNARTGRANWDGYDYTAPVLSYAGGVSPYGAFNMAGNVREWCGDGYDLGRYGYPSEEDPPTATPRGALPFGDTYYPNPWDKDAPDARVGPYLSSERSIRGGSFADPIERCRVDSRWAAGPDVHMNNVGFRTILPLPPQS